MVSHGTFQRSAANARGNALRNADRARRERRQFDVGYFSEGIDISQDGSRVVVAVRNLVSIVYQFHQPSEDVGRFYFISDDGWKPGQFIVEKPLDEIVRLQLLNITRSALALSQPVAYDEREYEYGSKFVLTSRGREIGHVKYKDGIHENETNGTQISGLEIAIDDNVPEVSRVAYALEEARRMGFLHILPSLTDPTTGQHYLARVSQNVLANSFLPDKEGYIQKLK